jgi:hypothetical protein
VLLGTYCFGRQALGGARGPKERRPRAGRRWSSNGQISFAPPPWPPRRRDGPSPPSEMTSSNWFGTMHSMNAYLLMVGMLLTCPTLAAPSAFRNFIGSENAVPVVVPWLSPNTSAQSLGFRLQPLRLDSERPFVLHDTDIIVIHHDEGVDGFRALVGLFLAVFVGFGTGPLVVGNFPGFLLFLAVDAAIFGLAGLASAVTAVSVIAVVALTVSHAFQVIDVLGRWLAPKSYRLERARPAPLLRAHTGERAGSVSSSEGLLSFAF